MTTVCGLDINKRPSWMMPDYVAFSTRALFDLGWRRGYTREDQALQGATPAHVQGETCDDG